MEKLDYYLVGIAGTAMASLAGLLKRKGYKVGGSDKRFYPPMGDMLKEERILTFNGYSVDNLKKVDVGKYIIGNAVSRGNVEVEYILQKTRHYLSLPDVIRDEFLEDNLQVIAVSGTHGKTTTTSLIHWLLYNKYKKVNLLVGGIPLNLNRSFMYHSNADYFVIEGDEYDSAFFDKRPKFINYRPDILVINNIEYDHGDIYPNLDAILLQFKYLLRGVPANGIIVANGDDANVRNILKHSYSKVITFGMSKENDAYFKYSINEDNNYVVDLYYLDDHFRFVSHLFGEHNIYNAVASYLVGSKLGISNEEFGKYLNQFHGIARRVNVFTLNAKQILIDDFAHHPTAIKTTIKGVKTKYPDYCIKVAYEPRSWTARTNVFQDAYVEAFSDADEVYFPPIEDVKRFEGKLIDLHKLKLDLEKLGKKAYVFDDIKSLADRITSELYEKEIILLLSNGSFGNLKQIILDKYEK